MENTWRRSPENSSAFQTGDATIAMRLVPDAVSLGGDVANDSISLAAVDVSESSEFQQYLTRRLRFDVSRENTWQFNSTQAHGEYWNPARLRASRGSSHG